MVYDVHILGLVIFKFCKLSKKQSMLDEFEIHVCSMVSQDNTQLHSKGMIYSQIRYTRYIPGIYQVYTRYILYIYHAKVSPLSCPPVLGSLRQRLPSDVLRFGHWEAAHTRLGPFKVPQLLPGVDLVNMLGQHHQHSSTQKRPSVCCCTYEEKLRLHISPESMEWEELRQGGPQPFQHREWEQVRACIPCEFPSIPWSQQSLSEVPQRGWRKLGQGNVLVSTIVASPPSTYGTEHTVEEQLGMQGCILSGSSSDSAAS